MNETIVIVQNGTANEVKVLRRGKDFITGTLLGNLNPGPVTIEGEKFILNEVDTQPSGREKMVFLKISKQHIKVKTKVTGELKPDDTTMPVNEVVE